MVSMRDNCFAINPSPEPATRNAGCIRLARRAFLGAGAKAAALAVLPFASAGIAGAAGASSGLIDVNVNVGRWPFRRAFGDEAAELVALLRAQGVARAWAGSIDGLLHKDLAAVNARLVDTCLRHGRGLLVPFGAVNPTLPDWEEDLRRCAEEHRLAGIRLHPNYHGYTLGEPVFARLLRLAAERGLIVQLALLMEDERMMHPRLRVSPVDAAPLVDLVRATPGLRLVLLNAAGLVQGALRRQLLAAGAVYLEVAMLEGVGGIAALLREVPLDRVLFGSHAPLYYFAAAKLKLQESPLTAAQAEAIRFANARRLNWR
jgi:predicted TIM-barrel fold metal-dependent hydrolase